MNEASRMEWKVCVGFPQYLVSECGDLRRKRTGAYMKGHINADGYPEYKIRNENGERKAVTAHRLVAMTFIGKPPSASHEVAHADGSRLNASFRNLRWATRKQNSDDRKTHGTNTIGERNGRAKITAKDVLSIRSRYREAKMPKSGMKVKDLADEYGIHHATFLDIAKGRSWSHIGDS